MRQGYTAPQVCKIVGISYRQLDHWTTSKLVKASIRSIKGSGHHREYAFDDLLRVKVIKNLRDSGMSLQKVRAALKSLDSLIRNKHKFSDVTVISDGQSIYASVQDTDFVDILKSGHVVFVIALGPVEKEVEEKIIDLYPQEKVSGSS